MEMYTKMKKREETCKNNMVSFKKNETVVLRIIYKSTLNVPTTPAACGGTGSSVKRSENWSPLIPSFHRSRKSNNNNNAFAICEVNVFSVKVIVVFLLANPCIVFQRVCGVVANAQDSERAG